MSKTIYLFEMQVKAAIFHQMKNDYERISTFKGNKSMKECQAIIKGWRQYAREKAL